MTVAMKADEAFDPVDVSLLRAKAVMPEADPGTDLVEQADAGRLHGEGVIGNPNRNDSVDDGRENPEGQSAIRPSDAEFPVNWDASRGD